MSSTTNVHKQPTVGTRRDALYEHVGAALLLLLFVLVLFGHLLFTNRVLASGDILLYFTPYRDYAAAAFRTGQIPLWNPYSFMGVPFLANPQAAVLYPLHWPLSWFPVTKQIYWSAAIHAWILGFGGYMLMRRWQRSALYANQSQNPRLSTKGMKRHEGENFFAYLRGSFWQNYGFHFARSIAGLTTGAILAGSGFYGGLIGHINQMNAAAWLPWLMVGLVDIRRPIPQSRIYLRAAGFGFCVAMMLLAGHTQTAYINLFGIGVWIIWPWRERIIGRFSAATMFPILKPMGLRLLIFMVGSLLGALMAAAQLFPTLELSQLGLRSGGLTYGEASSFSLRPLKLLWTLLPSYGLVDLGVIFGPAYSEFVAYIGLFGLLLALLGLWKGGGAARCGGFLFALLGLLLALGRWNPIYFVLYYLVPGFDLFRTPARWMMLYTLGVALLAGTGVDYLRWTIFDLRLGVRDIPRQSSIKNRMSSNLLVSVLVLLLAIELLVAARSLPHRQTTAEQAVYDVRTAPAHLLTDPARAVLGPAAAGRFLSMSTIEFDPGDVADYRRAFVDGPALDEQALDERAFEQLVIAQKAQEILAPNLPLLWRIPSVDGFDGGVLPLQRYIQALSLFVPPDDIVPDGRLREQVKEVPHADLLGLLNVQYVITDKVRDLWFDGIYYDRQLGAVLALDAPIADAKISIDVPPGFEATRLDLIGSAAGGDDRLFEQPIAVARVDVTTADTSWETFALQVGGGEAHFADGKLDSTIAVAGGAEVAYRDVEGGREEYRAQFAFSKPLLADQIEIALEGAASDADSGLVVAIRAATLVDERTNRFLPLVVSDRGRFARVHSGDVKIYENVDLLPRAYLVHEVVGVGSTEAALEYLQAGKFRPAQRAVVEGVGSFTTQRRDADRAEVVDYRAERVEIQTVSAEDALLVLSDSYYPGWSAMVDGDAAEIVPTNLLFRGVQIPAGEHTVVFEYNPSSWRRGRWLSGVGVLLWLGLFGVGCRLKNRRE